MKITEIRGFTFIIIVLFASLFTGCPFFYEQVEETEIKGIVTVARNGIPLNPEDFFYEQQFDITHLPHIYIYTTPPQYTGLFYENSPVGTIATGETSPVGVSNFYGSNHVAWLGDGKYQWVVRVPDNILPGVLYFEIFTQMNNVQHSLGLIEINDGIKVENADSIIDLGLFNFNIVQLSGKVPVTVDGDLADNAHMEVFLENGIHLCSAKINADGQWSQYVVVPGVETALRFRVEASKKGGNFKRDLITNTVYAISDIDKEFIFPEYPQIDFDAFNLSGTVKILGPDKKQAVISRIVFFREGFDKNYLFRDFNTLGSAEIRYLNPFGDGSAVWTATVQEFSFPQKLHFMVSASDGVGGQLNYFSINIADDTDLNNINLGNIF